MFGREEKNPLVAEGSKNNNSEVTCYGSYNDDYLGTTNSTPSSTTTNNEDDEECNGTSKRANVSKSAAPLLHKGNIGFWGSIAIAMNTLTGPGMLQLPATFQRSGLIPTTACISFVAMLCSMCALNFSNVISKVSGNANFRKDIEYSDVFRYFWGKQWYIITQIAFTVCILCQLMASIVDVAQVVDTFMGSTFANATSIQYNCPTSNSTLAFVQWDLDSACGEGVHQSGQSPIANGEEKATCVAFNRETDSSILLTSGYLLSLAIFLPMGLMDLKENIVWQIVGFVSLLVFSCQFAQNFWSNYVQEKYDHINISDNLSLWGHSWTGLFGIVLFNFTVATAVPAWLHEKEDKISVPQVIHLSNIGSAALYIIVGGLGALSMPHVDDNMLSSMIAGADGPALQIGASMFAFLIIGLGIPLFSVLLRLNLTGSGLCSQRTGNIIAVWIPWGLSWMLYQGSAVQKMLAWGGAIFTSFVAFIAPLLLELHANYVSSARGSISVFGGLIKTREGEFWALLCLSLATICAVVLAIFGLAMSGAETHADIHAVSSISSADASLEDI